MAGNRRGAVWRPAKRPFLVTAKDDMYPSSVVQLYPSHGGVHSPSSSTYVNTARSLSAKHVPVTQANVAEVANRLGMTWQQSRELLDVGRQATRDECERKHQHYMRQQRKAWKTAQYVALQANDGIDTQTAYQSGAQIRRELSAQDAQREREERKQKERNEAQIKMLKEVGSPVAPQLRGKRTLHSAAVAVNEHQPPFDINSLYIEGDLATSFAQRIDAQQAKTPAQADTVFQCPSSVYTLHGDTIVPHNYQPPDIMESPVPGSAEWDLPASNGMTHVHNYFDDLHPQGYMRNNSDTRPQDNRPQHLQGHLGASESEPANMSGHPYDGHPGLVEERVGRLEIGAQLPTAATMRPEDVGFVPVQHPDMPGFTFYVPVGSHMAMVALDPRGGQRFNTTTPPDRPIQYGHPTGMMSDPNNPQQQRDQFLPPYAIPHQPSVNDDMFNAIPDALQELAERPLSEVLGSVFDRIEGIVRYYTHDTDMDIFNYKNSKIQFLSRMGSDHIDSKNMAKTMFQDKELRVPLIIGIVNRCLSTGIFNIALLSNIYKDFNTDYQRAWNEEMRTKSIFELANDYNRRDIVNNERARLARDIVAFPDFWRAAHSYAWRLVVDITGHITPVLSPKSVAEVQSRLFEPIFDAVKTGVRMRMEPKVYENTFHRYGERWDHKMMAQRNINLVGQVCDEQPPIWVVRSTISPMFMEKDFAGGRIVMTTLHKAEVMLCDRKTHLRGK